MKMLKNLLSIILMRFLETISRQRCFHSFRDIRERFCCIIIGTGIKWVDLQGHGYTSTIQIRIFLQIGNGYLLSDR